MPTWIMASWSLHTCTGGQRPHSCPTTLLHPPVYPAVYLTCRSKSCAPISDPRTWGQIHPSIYHSICIMHLMQIVATSAVPEALPKPADAPPEQRPTFVWKEGQKPEQVGCGCVGVQQPLVW
jgi:hypothetical protein